MVRGRARVLALAAAAVLAGCPESHQPGQWDCTGSPCDDGEICNGTEICDADRGCLPGAIVGCDDGDPCTVDACSAGVCAHSARDLDADGHADRCAGGDDCAPEDPAIHPGAEEVCNDRDDDCDGDVDEGLPLEILDDVDRQLGTTELSLGTGAVLANGDVVSWTTVGVERVSEDGTERLDLIEDGAGGYIRSISPPPPWLVAGDVAWAAMPFGPVVGGRRGSRIRTYDQIQIVKLTATEMLAEPLFDPAPGQQVWPSVQSLAWLGPGPVPTLTYAAFIDGETRILAVPGDLSEAPARVAAVEARLIRAALLPFQGGALLLWADSQRLRDPGRLWADVLTADLVSTGVHQLLTEGLVTFEACPLPHGVAVVVDEGDAFRAFRVDRGPVMVELFETVGDVLRGVACRNGSIVLLEDALVRRFSLSGDLELTDELPWEFPTIVATSSGLTLAGRSELGQRELRRYGCRP